MAKRIFVAGATSQTIDLFIQDSSVGTGAGLSGLVFNTAGLTAYYRNTATGSSTQITLVTQTVGGAYTSGGFVEIDATNMKGMYRFDLPDAVFTSAPFSVVYLQGATNMVPCIAELEVENTNSALFGVNVVNVAGTAQTARDLGAQLDVAVSTRLAPTVAARTLDVSATGEAGVDWANVGGQSTSVNLSATTINQVNTVTTVTNQLTAAQIATGVWQDATAGDFTTASSIGKALYINDIVPGGSGGHFISGTNAGTTTFGAITCTGTFTISNGIVVTRSSSNSVGVNISGSGSGRGVVFNGGATGDAFALLPGVGGFAFNAVGNNTTTFRIVANGGNFPAVSISSAAGTNAITVTGGDANGSTPAGHAISLTGGAASTSVGGVAGNGLRSTGGAGAPTVNGAGEGVTIVGGGSTTVAGAAAASFTSTGNATAVLAVGVGTGKSIQASQGIVADITGNITGNLVGTVSTLTTYTGNTPQTGDSFARIGANGSGLTAVVAASVTGNVNGNVVGSVGSVTGLTASNLDATVSSRLASASYTAPDNADIVAIKTQTDKLTFTVANQIDSNIHYVNNIQVDGSGTTLDPWGPV